MGRSLYSPAECDACSDTDVGCADDSFVFKHDPAHSAFGVQPDAQFCNVVAVVVVVACEILLQHFSLFASCNACDETVPDIYYDGFIKNTYAKLSVHSRSGGARKTVSNPAQSA